MRKGCFVPSVRGRDFPSTPLEFLWLDSNRRKRQILICAHAGPMEAVPKKWPEQGAFSLDKTKTKNKK